MATTTPHLLTPPRLPASSAASAARPRASASLAHPLLLSRLRLAAPTPRPRAAAPRRHGRHDGAQLPHRPGRRRARRPRRAGRPPPGAARGGGGAPAGAPRPRRPPVGARARRGVGEPAPRLHAGARVPPEPALQLHPPPRGRPRQHVAPHRARHRGRRQGADRGQARRRAPGPRRRRRRHPAQEEIESLYDEESRLDDEIGEAKDKLQALTVDEDKRKGSTLVGINAPHGTCIEVPDPNVDLHLFGNLSLRDALPNSHEKLNGSH
ncbi:hypothetical protein ACP4OV_010264 [Aristida adscensionis]